MSKAKFTKSQIKDLIEVYQIEAKKLRFQTEKTRAILAELRADLKTAPEDAKPATKTTTPKSVAKKVTKKITAKKVAAKKPTTKKAAAKKSVTKKVVTKKPTTKKVAAKKVAAKKVAAKKVVAKKPATKKSTAKKSDGRKGNAGRKPIVTAWDNYVLDSIKESNKGITSNVLFSLVKEKAKAGKEYKNDATTKTLINRSLQKLVNKQKVIAKFKHAGRGFAYGLPEWGSRGRLKPAFKV